MILADSIVSVFLSREGIEIISAVVPDLPTEVKRGWPGYGLGADSLGGNPHCSA